MQASRYQKLFGAISCMLLLTKLVLAQDVNDTSRVRALLDKVDRYHAAFSPEQIYLRFDKPYYAVGDTAWFKAYVMAGGGHKASVKSAKLYVELLNSDSKVIKLLAIPVFEGLAQGFLPFDEKTVADGGYTIRAYTNWQQNFGAQAFFYKQISVGAAGKDTWLLTEQHQQGTGADSAKVQLAMRLNDNRGLPVAAEKVSLRLLDHGTNLLKSEMMTGVDGVLKGALIIPAKADKRSLSIIIESTADKRKRMQFPFVLSGGDIDLQFLPEGGNLVAGALNRVAFKTIGEDGLSREVQGVVMSSKGEDVANFQSFHKGMGSFLLVPQAGEMYTAKITVDGKEKRYALPPVKSGGIGLRVDGVSHTDDLYIYITAPVADGRKYLLVARSRDKVYFGSSFGLNSEGVFNTHINKAQFPTGIVNIAVIDADNAELCRRNVFIDHRDALQIATMTKQAAFAPGDSVIVDVHVTDKYDHPIQGSFSLAVTDDAQIKNAVQQDNIQTHILLSSELKGNIEDPAWYFENGDEQLKQKALDDLLLTQGWQATGWDMLITSPPVPAYLPEPDLNVTGQLRNLFNKPAVGLTVRLMGVGKQLLLMDTISDKQGQFTFKDLPMVDTPMYTIKLHKVNNNSAAAAIMMNEFVSAKLPLPLMPRSLPLNMNADSTLLNYIRQVGQRNMLNNLFMPTGGGTLLKEARVTAGMIPHDVNGEIALQIDSVSENTLIAANKISLMDVLQKELKGTLKESYIYAIKIGGSSDGRLYKLPDGRIINDQRVTMHTTKQFVIGTMRVNDIIVDGQSVGQMTQSLRLPSDVSSTELGATKWGNSQKAADEDFFTRSSDVLNMLGGEDVKSVKVVRGQFLSIIITTRSGKGLNAKPSVGTYVYRPLPIQMPKQFYAPRYDVKNEQPGLRSTIYWEPNLVTDAQGNGRITFYAGNKPSTYTLIAEGTDMQGHFGVSSSKITVTQNTAGVK